MFLFGLFAFWKVRSKSNDSLHTLFAASNAKCCQVGQQRYLASNKKTVARCVMEAAEVVAALDSPTRRHILRVLGAHAMTAKEVFLALKRTEEVSISCRESAYKALERLVSTGLVQKLYDAATKAIRYRLVHSEIIIGLSSGTAHWSEE